MAYELNSTKPLSYLLSFCLLICEMGYGNPHLTGFLRGLEITDTNHFQVPDHRRGPIDGTHRAIITTITTPAMAVITTAAVVIAVITITGLLLLSFILKDL